MGGWVGLQRHFFVKPNGIRIRDCVVVELGVMKYKNDSGIGETFPPFQAHELISVLSNVLTVYVSSC